MSAASFDDPALIDAARAGDALAFDSLVGPLIEPAFKLAVVFLRNSDEAQDAVQEACLKAWTGLGGLRGTAVRPWFLTIVANQCRSQRRARWWSVLRLESLPRADPWVEERHDLQIDLDRELARLPENDRAVLFLFFYLDLPLGEVGRILGITPQAAKSRVHRALRRLRLGMVEVAT